jgi:ribonuclease-3 family protein
MIKHSGLTLAYLGDAIYEVLVREYLLEKGLTKVDHLHKEAIRYTSAEGQADAYQLIEPFLSEEETSIYKRGRNAKTDRKAKNASVASYRHATGLEALIGYLYMNKQKDRIHELFDIITKTFDK